MKKVQVPPPTGQFGGRTHFGFLFKGQIAYGAYSSSAFAMPDNNMGDIATAAAKELFLIKDRRFIGLNGVEW